MSDNASFGYRITRTRGGWLWSTYDLRGELQHHGEAPSKALAAALVIRALARTHATDRYPNAA
jgi:hypothetical protein